jgi:hypothetical protein
MRDLRYDEPALDEMLDDPVVRAVMARDRLRREDVLACVERARERLRVVYRKPSGICAAETDGA